MKKIEKIEKKRSKKMSTAAEQLSSVWLLRIVDNVYIKSPEVKFDVEEQECIYLLDTVLFNKYIILSHEIGFPCYHD